MWRLVHQHVIGPWQSASALRRNTVIRWTSLGTLGCIIVSLLINVIIFAGLDTDARLHALLGATIIPVLLAVPLFWLMSMKLRDLAVANRKLEQLATTDALTGCLNRGAFSAMVDDSLARQVMSDTTIGALLIIDADHFKRINDRYGHDKGDVALRLIADRIGGVLRAGDLLGRMGGEEFGVFLPGADASHAESIAERVRRAVAEAQFQPGDRQYKLSVSIGCAAFAIPVGFTELFKLADERLYQAKSQGRNRVLVGHLRDKPAPDWFAGSLH